MDLDNPFETIVNYFLIGGMTYLGRWDGFPMVSALVYVMHTGQTYSESWYKANNFHDSPSYYTTWILNLDRILSMCQSQQKVLTYRWDFKVVTYTNGLGSNW